MPRRTSPRIESFAWEDICLGSLNGQPVVAMRKGAPMQEAEASGEHRGRGRCDAWRWAWNRDKVKQLRTKSSGELCGSHNYI